MMLFSLYMERERGGNLALALATVFVPVIVTIDIYQSIDVVNFSRLCSGLLLVGISPLFSFGLFSFASCGASNDPSAHHALNCI